MRTLIGLAFSLALPWLAGTLAVLALCRTRARRDWPLAAGYGYLLGAFAVTLALRLCDLAGVRWTLLLVAVPMAVLAALLFVVVRRIPDRAYPFAPMGAALRDLSGPQRVLFWFCFALVALRAGDLALEIALRPLLPWDAWAHWSTKARVWFEFGRLAPFVSERAWFAAADPMRFVDMHPDYPATVPLLQVWTNLALGRWDESLMSAPWLAALVALGLAFHAQLQRSGLDSAKAMLWTYLLLSLPFLDVHVALAGTADLFIAVCYGLASMALWQWTRRRARADLALAAAMAVMCVTVKVEGVLWAATLVPPLVVALNRRLGLALVGVLAATAALYLAFGPPELKLFGYVLRTQFANVSLPLGQHLFVMDNWHLFWYAAAGIVVLRFRRMWRPALLPLTINIAGAVALVVVIYFFSSASGGVDDESLVNRLPLQMIVALSFYLALLLAEPASAVAAARRSKNTQAYAADA